jgi:hypothetical protein
MKKIFFLLGVVLISVLITPMFSVLAQNDVPNGCHIKFTPPASLKDSCKLGVNPAVGAGTVEDWCPIGSGDPTTADCGMCCFIQTVNNITDWVFYVMTAIAVLLFVYGGITYMIALGDPEKASKGGRIIIYAIIGLIIALVAKIVPNIVTTLVR